ncbi:MAG TPA: ECF-type sigma factor [Gemmatimonadales bacterium]|nr:ECF-type sigma factor [Gemmatimonadaceae bacterium]HXE82542.1 ECF-type sigma factor [Gemmatimonadales bacterium]
MPRLSDSTRDALATDESMQGMHVLDRLFPVVYEELRRLAHRRLRSESPGHTLSTTALVNETYLKLAKERGGDFQSRERFFALAARAMRRILVDYARRHHAQKRMAQGERISLAGLEGTDALLVTAAQVTERADLLIGLDDALDRLAEVDQRLARVVEYRFFTGLTEEETAELLGVSSRTVKRDWARARGWLLHELSGSRAAPA